MGQVISVLLALLVFGIIVFVHELGHFVSGRILGAGIEEFSMGMGPKIIGRKCKGVEYSWRAIPFGAFVRFEGEEEGSSSPTALYNVKPWKRLIILVSGVFMNVVFALVCALVALLAYGSTTPKIIEVTPDSPAALAGVLPDDLVTGADGRQFSFAYELFDAIADADGSVRLQVQRGGEALEIQVSDIYDAQRQGNLLGVTIDSSTVPKRFSLGGALGGSFKLVGYYIRQMFEFLGNLFSTPDIAGQVMGPVGAIDVMSQAVQFGFSSVLSLALLISINLAVFNLLPIPGLDGMRMVFVFIEMIRGKPIPRDKEGWVHGIGVLLLMAFMVYITFGDIQRIFGR